MQKIYFSLSIFTWCVSADLIFEKMLHRNKMMASVWFDLPLAGYFLCPAFSLLFCRWQYKFYRWLPLTWPPFTAMGEQGHCHGRRTVLKGQAQVMGTGVTLRRKIQNLIFFRFSTSISSDYSANSKSTAILRRKLCLGSINQVKH